MTRDENVQNPKLSRAEIETLCILSVVGKGGCPAGDLASRLGLSPTLASAVAEGMTILEDQGILERVDDKFSVTEAGAEMLTTRLATLGLS